MLCYREKCVEVYLYQLFALLRADKYNIALLSGKVQYIRTPHIILHMYIVYYFQGLLERLLDAFAPLFNSESERCISK